MRSYLHALNTLSAADWGEFTGVYGSECRITRKKALAYRGQGGQNTDIALLPLRLGVVLRLLRVAWKRGLIRKCPSSTGRRTFEEGALLGSFGIYMAFAMMSSGHLPLMMLMLLLAFLAEGLVARVVSPTFRLSINSCVFDRVKLI